ncbi:D-alanyl-D-alanine carboxypeptidase [Amycolatopsis rhabdoformis]|uniref:D-alanyl-D-alanine carboxypeptidase n=1 Tax=Amycolatopsis rhabdoformis TaxID=1448059 RepID=A0ABZ1ICS4_9PSEU|nr:D-alanyl-D-alanine carboxypeptidase [Amycolatopsis rhabdoformis]WSE31836.1 D-alanyl-D-alanine carboxypeptidase [Amycolatopsis rhabdoformis]
MRRPPGGARFHRLDDARRRDVGYRLITRLLAFALWPFAVVLAPGRARSAACAWALRIRFPAEDLTGLSPGTLAAFTAARATALWRDGTLLGLTSGHRDAQAQHRLFTAEAGRAGTARHTLPPALSRHVTGSALDVRPRDGARWLERHGAAHHLYRVYDNEWWHFEYHPEGRPPRVPHPGFSLADAES